MITIFGGCKCDANSFDFQPPKLKIVLASIILKSGPSTTVAQGTLFYDLVLVKTLSLETVVHG